MDKSNPVNIVRNAVPQAMGQVIQGTRCSLVPWEKNKGEKKGGRKKKVESNVESHVESRLKKRKNA